MAYRESLAVRRSKYVPAAEKLAAVTGDACGLKLTVPGPLTFPHDTASVEPIGRPSSIAVPFKAAVAGSVISRSGPALASGGRLPDTTVIVTSEVAFN